ncbi:uncharacterized protein N7518_002608 [Penicillium psychrosexuale]|uniref:uncharacterized protein n=1 Tax=Penicillium psychrosexuale TaxID=1002107 RepID=UPI0025457066|nr:uncharacterized protein N7518_002608 [Penicillium psychrosexuale]KAJ5800540.1 hypothetical protein N7518_002608 [Penicillium psychrosexuale]
MSDLSLQGQELKKVPYHDHPPQYDSYQPDLLTSVIENEYNVKILIERLGKLYKELTFFADNIPDQPSHPQTAELSLGMARLFTEGTAIGTELANLYKERTDQNTELYIAISRLTRSEFDRAYASLRRDPNRQMRDKLAQDPNNPGDFIDTDHGYNSQRSRQTKQVEGAGNCTVDDRFFELSAKGDKPNDKLGQSLGSHDMVNVSSTTNDAPAQPPTSFWRRILNGLARPVKVK